MELKFNMKEVSNETFCSFYCNEQKIDLEMKNFPAFVVRVVLMCARL